ncbi:hypothetical protein EIN_308310, partial [Entamoeba invadens IP1]
AVSSCIQLVDVIGQLHGYRVLVQCGISEVLCWGVSRKERRIQVSSLMLIGHIFDSDIHSINPQALALLTEKMVSIVENGLHEGVCYAIWDLNLLISNLQREVAFLFGRVVKAVIAVVTKNVLIKPAVLQKNVVMIMTTIGALDPEIVVDYLALLTSEETLPHVLTIPNEFIRFNVLRLLGVLICLKPQNCLKNVSCIGRIYTEALKQYPHLIEIWSKIQAAFAPFNL